jgi:two-component system, NarL family, nitrate/nitrite response regulator NarL
MNMIANNQLEVIPSEEQPLASVLLASATTVVCQRWKDKLRDSPYAIYEVIKRTALDGCLRIHKPSLLLLDLTMLTRSHVVGISRLGQLSPQTKIIALSPFPSEAEGVAALRAGARGYCQQDIDDVLLRRATESVLQGEVWASHRIVSSLFEEFQAAFYRFQRLPRKLTTTSLNLLTSREYEITCLLKRGASNREIAQELQLAERTVKAHMTAIFRKLGVSDRVRLALFMTGQSIA